MELNEGEVRFRLTLTWSKLPESDDPTEDNPHHALNTFIGQLWQRYYLGEEWGDESTFAAKREIDEKGATVVTLDSTMPEAMGEVMNWFAMEMSYFYSVGTGCKFEKIAF